MDYKEKDENSSNVKENLETDVRQEVLHEKEDEIKYEKINEAGQKVVHIAKDVKTKIEETTPATKKGAVAVFLAIFVALFAWISFKGRDEKPENK